MARLFRRAVAASGWSVLATIPVLVLGWIMRSNPGLVLGGILWPLVLVAAFLMAVLLLGLLFGWPLMWAAISAEGTDSFDALSRTYAYVFQRPLRYLFYIIVAGIIGWLGWIVVREFAAGIVWLGYWAAGWGCGHDTVASILNPGEELKGVGPAGALADPLLGRLRENASGRLLIQLLLDRLGRRLFPTPPRRRRHRNGRSIPGR